MKKIFVVILNWNRAEDTIECLKSIQELTCLRRQGIKNYELSILIVDNGSTDGSVEKIRKFIIPDSRFKILINKVNLGFAGGNNIGIRYALKEGADYILILNNDTTVDPVSMIRIIESAVKIHNFGIASPKIYFAKGFEFHKGRYKATDLGKVIWYAGGIIDWDNVYGVCRGVDEVDNGQYNNAVSTDFATGTCMLVSAEALKKVGLFNEKYFMYYEDTDLSIRIKRSGLKVLYCPEGAIWHKVAQSSGIGSELNDYFITRNRLLFGLKYAPLRSKAALVKESIKLFSQGRKWQRVGVRDFYTGRFGKGSWIDE